MEEKDIIELIKSKQYSLLSFLEDDSVLEKNENYYSFLYFLKDSKSEDTKGTLDKIVEKKGSLSSCYEYLGRVALKVYPSTWETHIASSFFKSSIEKNRTNSSAWWYLYLSGGSSKAFLESLKIDYKKEMYHLVEEKLKDENFSYLNSYNLTTDEWEDLISIILDKKLSCEDECKQHLISAYFYLGRFNEGVRLINSSKNVQLEMVRKYYEKGKISKDMALSKIYLFQVDSFLGDDHSRIYEEYLKYSKNREENPYEPALIEKAFKAREYSDVIKIYNSINDERFPHRDLASKIYNFLSKIKINNNIDKKLELEIKGSTENIHTDPGLYTAFEAATEIQKLKTWLSEEKYTNNIISVMGPFQRTSRLLEDSKLLTHYLYNELYNDLEKIGKEWDDFYFESELNSILSNQESSGSSYQDFIEFCSLGIRNSHYDEVLEKIKSYHESNLPTIKTYNLSGICFERKGMFSNAFQEYQKSVDLMETHKEFHHVILSNYIECARKGSIIIPNDKYEKLRENLNTDLVDSFKLSPHATRTIGTLYKYYPLNLNTLDSIINQYFYLPSKSQLNDPIELPELENIGEHHLIDSNYKICSFSNNPNSILMWSHYTNNHEGIMIEYKFGGELPTGVGVKDVKYTNGNKREREKNQYIFNQFLLTKNDEWSYEEEVRIISYKKSKIYYESYRYPFHDRNKVNASISSITLGCKYPYSKLHLIKNLVNDINEKREKHDEPKIVLRKAEISKTNIFGIRYIEV